MFLYENSVFELNIIIFYLHIKLVHKEGEIEWRGWWWWIVLNKIMNILYNIIYIFHNIFNYWNTYIWHVCGWVLTSVSEWDWWVDWKALESDATFINAIFTGGNAWVVFLQFTNFNAKVSVVGVFVATWFWDFTISNGQLNYYIRTYSIFWLVAESKASITYRVDVVNDKSFAVWC